MKYRPIGKKTVMLDRWLDNDHRHSQTSKQLTVYIGSDSKAYIYAKSSRGQPPRPVMKLSDGSYYCKIVVKQTAVTRHEDRMDREARHGFRSIGPHI